MRNTIPLLCFIVVLVFFPMSVFAHGGFEKKAGEITVYINQSPISPLVGENVKINFVFKKEGEIQPLSNFEVDVSVIDTFYGNQSKDKIVYKKKFITDANGSFDFNYIFNKENYFDVELVFKDSKGNIQTTGFLVQPRLARQIQKEFFSYTGIIGVSAFLFGSITTYILIKLKNTHG